MQKIIITAVDGYPLSAIYARPTGKSSGTIVLSSATGIKKEFYLHFAHFLVEEGYTILLYDYRGIGGSAPKPLKSSNAFIHEWGTKDMNAVLDYLVNERGHSDIVWMGHSIGAQLVGFLDNQQHIRKVISINAAVGYWAYFPFPMNVVVWTLWYIISPVLIKLYGYGTMKKVGWGEDLPKNVILEWRKWCMSKYYYRMFLRKKLHTDRFYSFTIPTTAIYTSDDYIANDKTAGLMKDFFPNSNYQIQKLLVKKYTTHAVGHIGLFRQKFRNNLWPLLAAEIRKAA
jgi:predicted alpha/beta hydrolase